MSTNEPKWPTVDEAIEAWNNSSSSAHSAEIAIELCRAAWLAATDDPEADLPGTVRISPDNAGVVRSGSGWFDPVATGNAMDPKWWLNSEVIGWTRGTPVEGTPAAKAAGQ